MSAPPQVDRTAGSLTEVATVFLRLGLLAFGGPAAHVALMENEFVRRRHWLTREEFLDLLGATNLIPGPNSTEMAMHLGRRRAGWLGLVVGGVCFILPAFLIVWFLAWAYLSVQSLPNVNRLLYGVKPVVIAVILQALVALGRTALSRPFLVVLSLFIAGLAFWGVDELVLLFGAGLIAAAAVTPGRQPTALPAMFLPLSQMPLAASAPGLLPLFLVFLKVGAILFGSGYVLFAFLQHDLVEQRQWLTESELLEAIAVGQATPGPVSTAATFIGYRLAGTLGAVVATVGIFLPAFVFVAASGPLVPRLRNSRRAAAFLDGVNVAALALMAVVSWRLGRDAIVDPVTASIAGAALFLLIRYRLNSLWLIAAGGLAGLALAP